jgi:hypothetical protein
VNDRRSVLFGNLPEIGRVRPGDHQDVALCGLSTVEEGHGPIVLVHDVCRCLAPDDLAENAIDHEDSLAAPDCPEAPMQTLQDSWTPGGEPRGTCRLISGRGRRSGQVGGEGW